MPPVSLLIKPVSGTCNMNCSYCFYRDIIQNRNVQHLPCMTDNTLETLISKTFSYAEGSCMIAFQGGEPTLAGLPFFKKAIDLAERCNVKKIPVRYAFQTNGLAVTPEWARFFRTNNVLVGLSLDGPPEIHNANRKDAGGKPTYNAAVAAASALAKAGTDFNILSVVTDRTARNTQTVYDFFKKRRFKYLQFIPCLAPLDNVNTRTHTAAVQQKIPQYPLSAESYGTFLKELFELWYKDVCKGQYVSIRQFDNYLSILKGTPPEACDMGGMCSVQYVAESDGSIYPCDFYALDTHCLGNINSVSFAELNTARKRIHFIEESEPTAHECTVCKYFTLCRGGCKRHRIMNLQPTATADVLRGQSTGCRTNDSGKTQPEPAVQPLPLNYFCPAYTDFFDTCLNRLIRIAHSL